MLLKEDTDMGKQAERKMTTEQYAKVNRYALVMMLVMELLIGGMSLLHIIASGFSGKDFVLLLVAGLVAVVDVIGFLIGKSNKFPMYVNSIGWMLLYTLTIFMGKQNPIVLLFPVLVVLMLYLEPVVITAVIGYSLLLHIVKLIMAGAKIHQVDMQTYQSLLNEAIVEVIGLIAMSIGTFLVTRFLLRYIMESQAQVRSKAEQQIEVAASVEETAGVISEKFTAITEQLDELVHKFEDNNAAIGNIAESTEATAEAIQEQVGLTDNIKERIDTTAQNASDIVDTTDSLYDVVSEGIEVVEGLQEQTEMVDAQTNETTESIQKLADNVDEVNSITKSILDISSQTNLLALNASIEAARAGEAGKGFAVVADEIRNLAEQTKSSTEQITSIINDLTAVTKESMGKLKTTVDSVHAQADMVQKVNDTFMETCKNIDELKEYTDSITDNVDAVIDANNHIIDSIHQLSASAEQVSGSSQEGMAVSNVILEQMQGFAAAVEEMTGMVEQLSDSVIQEEE